MFLQPLPRLIQPVKVCRGVGSRGWSIASCTGQAKTRILQSGLCSSFIHLLCIY